MTFEWKDEAFRKLATLALQNEPAYTKLQEMADELEHMQKVIDRTAVLRLDLEVANNKMTAEIEQLQSDLLKCRESRLAETLRDLPEWQRDKDEIEQLRNGLGERLVVAWDKYVELFGQPPHGTLKQMNALCALLPETTEQDCDHTWITGNFGPTQCSKCGVTSPKTAETTQEPK